MTLHPWHLHAYTALVDLAKSWPLVRVEAGRAQLAASDGIQTPRFSHIRAHRPAGDGGMLRMIEQSTDDTARWQLLLDRIAQAVVDALWYARACTTLKPARGPLGILAAAIPATQPTYARDIAQALHGADRTARAALQLDDDRLPMTGVPCPHCGHRQLKACTSSPNRHAWTVVCTGECGGIWRWTWIAAWDLAQRQTARSSTSTTIAA